MGIFKKMNMMITGQLRSQRGMVLAVVLGFVGLMAMSTMSFSTMVQRDINLVHTVKTHEQAMYMAEAGINHALARIRLNGFSSRANFSGALDTGTYSVTYSTVSSRYMVTSIGTVSGVSETVTAELEDNTPTALFYFSGAGNDLKIYCLVALATITGDIHANHDVNLASGPLISWLRITGDVSATGIVKEGALWHDGGSGFSDLLDNHVVINGMGNDTATVYESQPRITFPTFTYDSYKQAAQASGNYYSSSQTFNNVTLTPANGIVYVDGDATFRGTCRVNGGVIANNILVINTLEQRKAGSRNVVIAKGGDIRVFGRLYTEEALVYASQDILSVQALAEIDINGIMLAGRNIDMWNFITLIDYNYIYVSPSDMRGANGEDTFRVRSWNK
jgi:hypothetical protein